MCPIQRSDYSVSLYTTTTIQYILYNVIIQLWGVITMVNLFLVYFSALLLYTTTIQYIDKRRVKRTLRVRLVCVCVCVYILLLYSIYYKNSSAKKGWGVLSPIYYYYYILLVLYSTRESTPMGGKFFLKKVWKYGFSVVSLWGGVYIKKVYNKLDSRMWINLT